MPDVPTLRIAVCQILVIDGDRDGNFRRIDYALEAARSGGAVLAAFPESAILGWQNPRAHTLAEPIPGTDSDRIAALARRYGLTVLIGLDELDGERLFDSAIIIDDSGAILCKHRKLAVLPGLMTPSYEAGSPDDIGVVETAYGRIGVLICADTIEDAHVDRLRALAPELVIVPYGWAAAPDEWPAHADLLEELVSRRASQLGCPVVGVNLVGVMSSGPWAGRTYGGSSVVADSSGAITHRLRDRDVEVRMVEIEIGRAGTDSSC